MSSSATRFSDDAWGAKLDVLVDLRPEVVSFTFGLPTAEECGRLRDAGITTVGTVTTVAEAETAADSASTLSSCRARPRVDIAARSTPRPCQWPNRCSTSRRRDRPRRYPVIAAGGLASADDIKRVIQAGAVAVQLGTAFLLADEAGSSPVHRAALRDPQFTETVVTRAFSGRYGRGLRNRFIDAHEAEAPFGYPQVHYLTGPLRAASVRAGDPQGMNVWAGTGFRQARAAPAAEIVKSLA